MIRLHITSEGQTEQRFVERVLKTHLEKRLVFTDARCVLTRKDNRTSREYRGGLLNYEKAKYDIRAWLKEDRDTMCRFTTMFDLYALPNNFPGYVEAMKKADKYERVRLLEEEMGKDIGDWRFIPYIQLHEFEALIFADPQQLDWEYLEHDGPIKNLIDTAKNKNPELINDDPQTAPSKRIMKEIPEYDKVTAGVSVTEKIGLQTLREKCRHFHEWISRLENLSPLDPLDA